MSSPLLSHFQTNYTSFAREMRKKWANTCNSCQKVLLTVKNMHTPEHHHCAECWKIMITRRNIISLSLSLGTRIRFVVLNFNGKVYVCVIIFRSLHPPRRDDSVTLFKNQFITYEKAEITTYKKRWFKFRYILCINVWIQIFFACRRSKDENRK